MKLDVLYFETRSEAEMVLDKLEDIASINGSTTLQDYCDLVGIKEAHAKIIETVGWTYNMLQNAKIVSSINSKLGMIKHYIELPIPTDIIQSTSLDSNIKIYKEENTMRPTTKYQHSAYYTPVNLNRVEDPAEIEYEQKRKDLMDEADKKINDIRKELAVALQKLDQERKDAERIAIEKKRAEICKSKYDALVEAGFTAEQAWEMTMKSFEMD